MIRAYVEGTMEGLRYTRNHQEEALRILLKLKPELDKELTRVQIKNGVSGSIHSGRIAGVGIWPHQA
jgi:ABC-type nitrate/sulfonate/bicarbonate transport system substrate-binding protein